MKREIHLEGKIIIEGKRYSQGKHNCSACGKFVNGNVYVVTEEKDTKFVCNVQCGINFVGRKK